MTRYQNSDPDATARRKAPDYLDRGAFARLVYQTALDASRRLREGETQDVSDAVDAAVSDLVNSLAGVTIEDWPRNVHSQLYDAVFARVYTAYGTDRVPAPSDKDYEADA